MNKNMTIEMPEELARRLEAKAKAAGLSLEALIMAKLQDCEVYYTGSAKRGEASA